MSSSTQLAIRSPDSQVYAPAAPVAAEGAGPSLAQIRAIVGARWKASLIIALAVIALAAVVTKLMPKTYKATATLLLNYDVNDPLTGKEFPMGLLGSYMATQVDLMQSSEILRPVIARLKLTEDENFASGNRGGEATLLDWVETALRKAVDIEPGRAGSQLMYVTATAEKSNQAAEIANTIADVYLSQQTSRLTTPAVDRAGRYTQQLEDLKKKVSDAQEALTTLRKKTGAIDLSAKTDVEMDILANLEGRLLESQNMSREARARAQSSQSSSTQAQGSDLARGLQAQLAAQNERMASLRTSLGPAHPQVLQLQSEINATRASLSSAGRTFSDAAGSELKARLGAQGDLENSVAKQRSKVLESRSARDEAAKLQLELESAQSVYKRALEGYDQVLVATTGKFTNVSLVSQARPPVKAAKPNPIMNMVLGLIAGILLGIAGPFVYELLNRRVRCRDDVERDLGIPVLTEFHATHAAVAGGN